MRSRRGRMSAVCTVSASASEPSSSTQASTDPLPAAAAGRRMQAQRCISSCASAQPPAPCPPPPPTRTHGRRQRQPARVRQPTQAGGRGLGGDVGGAQLGLVVHVVYTHQAAREEHCRPRLHCRQRRKEGGVGVGGGAPGAAAGPAQPHARTRGCARVQLRAGRRRRGDAHHAPVPGLRHHAAPRHCRAGLGGEGRVSRQAGARHRFLALPHACRTCVPASQRPVSVSQEHMLPPGGNGSGAKVCEQQGGSTNRRARSAAARTA